MQILSLILIQKAFEEQNLSQVFHKSGQDKD